MPLGDTYTGVCHARPGDPIDPPGACQREFCNRGYARGQCECFPPDATADAIRFSITGEEDGRVRLVYVMEKDHKPVEHGPLEFTETLRGAEGREILAAQAGAFLESYRRRPV